MNYWLLKTEPSTFSWDDLVRDKIGHWDGVRNYLARNNLRAMKHGDLVFVYHSVEERCLKGGARVVREASADHTAADGEWSMVDVAPVQALPKTVSLQDVKKNPVLACMMLVTHSRLSVQPVSAAEWAECLQMAGMVDKYS